MIGDTGEAVEEREHYTVDGPRHRLKVSFGGRSRFHVIHDQNFPAATHPGRWTRRGVDRRSLCGSLTYCMVGVDAAQWPIEMQAVDDVSRVDCKRCRERYDRLFPSEVSA